MEAKGVDRQIFVKFSRQYGEHIRYVVVVKLFSGHSILVLNQFGMFGVKVQLAHSSLLVLCVYIILSYEL